MALRAYIAEGGSAEDGTDGFRETVIYRVDGMTGDQATWLDRALQASGLPARFQAHPSRRGAIVTKRTATPDGPDAVRISILYSVPQGSGLQLDTDSGSGVLEVDATVTSEVVTLDINDNPITVTYDKPTEDDGDTVLVADTQAIEANKQVAQMVLRRTRNESRARDDLARRYVGTVNRFSVWGYAAETILCTAIRSRSTDNGLTYEVAYEFQYNPRGWKFEAVYIDDETNRPPVDLIAGRGRKYVQVQPVEDFRRLPVSF